MESRVTETQAYGPWEYNKERIPQITEGRLAILPAGARSRNARRCARKGPGECCDLVYVLNPLKTVGRDAALSPLPQTPALPGAGGRCAWLPCLVPPPGLRTAPEPRGFPGC